MANIEAPVLLAFHGLRGVGKDTSIRFVSDWADEFDPAPSVVRRGFADKMKWAYMRMWVPNCTMEWAIDFIDQWKNDPEATLAGIFADDEGIVLSDSSRQEKLPHNDDDTPLYFISPVVFRNHMDQFATESAREVYGDDHWVNMLLPYQDERHVEGWKEAFMIPPTSEADWPYSIASYCCINDLRADNEVARIKSIPGSLCIKVKRRDREEQVRAQYEGKEVHLFAQELPDRMFDVIINNDDNNMDQARRRVGVMMNEIKRNGPESIKRGHPQPWRIT